MQSRLALQRLIPLLRVNDTTRFTRSRLLPISVHSSIGGSASFNSRDAVDCRRFSSAAPADEILHDVDTSLADIRVGRFLSKNDDMLPDREEILQSIAKQINLDVKEWIVTLSTMGHWKKRPEELERRWARNLQREQFKTRRRRKELELELTNGQTLQQSWSDALETWELQALVMEKDDHLVLSSYSPIFGLSVDDKGQVLDFDVATVSTECADISVSEEVSTCDSMQYSTSVSTSTAFVQAPEEVYADTISHVIALLRVTSSRDWGYLVKDELMSPPTLTSDRCLANISDLLRQLRDSGTSLSTVESNLLLAHVVSTSLHVDQALDYVLNLYYGMILLSRSGREECGPDMDTYRLLMLALSKQMMAGGEAMKLVHDMMSSPLEITSSAFHEAVNVAFIRNDLECALSLLDRVTSEGQNLTPPVTTIALMMEMMKSRNQIQEAFDLFQRVKKGMAHEDDEDRLLMCLSRWPTKTRRGDTIDSVWLNQRLLAELHVRIDEMHTKPNLAVWAQVIDSLCYNAKSDKSLYRNIARAVKTVLVEYNNAGISNRILKSGLEASESTLDAELAAAIVQEYILHNDAASRSPQPSSLPPAKVPLGIFRVALNVCVRCKRPEEASSVIRSFMQVKDLYPAAPQCEMYSKLLLCHVRANQGDAAKSVLFQMLEAGMKPSEDLFGAVIHSVATSGNIAEAKALFHKFTDASSTFGVQHSTACFNAMLLSCIREKEWEDACQVVRTMKDKRIPFSGSTTEGSLLANFHLHGQEGAMAVIDDAISRQDSSLNASVMQLAIRLLCPALDGTIDEVREKIRQVGTNDSQMYDVSLELIRALRTAQVEESRAAPTEADGLSTLNATRDAAWRQCGVAVAAFVREA